MISKERGEDASQSCHADLFCKGLASVVVCYINAKLLFAVYKLVGNCLIVSLSCSVSVLF